MSKQQRTGEPGGGNELLQLQLEQVQQELEYYIRAYKELSDDSSGRDSGSETHRGKNVGRLVPPPELLQRVSSLCGSGHTNSPPDFVDELDAVREELQSAYSHARSLESSNDQLRRLLLQHVSPDEAENGAVDRDWDQWVLEYERAVSARTAEHDALSAERDSLKAALERQLSEHRSEVEALESDLQQRAKETEEAVSAVCAERDAALASAQRQQDELMSQITELKEAESNALQALNLAHKISAKAQSDLDSLREKYRRKDENEHHLVDLIRQLRDKLQLASQYYQQLQETHPDLLED